jgi:membrane protease subunit (stomatin/prohibitin family)
MSRAMDSVFFFQEVINTVCILFLHFSLVFRFFSPGSSTEGDKWIGIFKLKRVKFLFASSNKRMILFVSEVSFLRWENKEHEHLSR